MEIKTVTIVIRGAGGGSKKAIYNADGECVSGDHEAVSAILADSDFRPGAVRDDTPVERPTPSASSTSQAAPAPAAPKPTSSGE